MVRPSSRPSQRERIVAAAQNLRLGIPKRLLRTYTWPAFGGPEDIRFAPLIPSFHEDREYGLITFFDRIFYLPNDAKCHFTWQTTMQELQGEDAIDEVAGAPHFLPWERNANPEALVARMLRMAPEWPKWVAEQKKLARDRKHGDA